MPLKACTEWERAVEAYLIDNFCQFQNVTEKFYLGGDSKKHISKLLEVLLSEESEYAIKWNLEVKTYCFATEETTFRNSEVQILDSASESGEYTGA